MLLNYINKKIITLTLCLYDIFILLNSIQGVIQVMGMLLVSSILHTGVLISKCMWGSTRSNAAFAWKISDLYY